MHSRCSVGRVFEAAVGAPNLLTAVRIAALRMSALRELFDLAIAHIDCDAFYASVEKRDNPEIRDRPSSSACANAASWRRPATSRGSLHQVGDDRRR